MKTTYVDMHIHSYFSDGTMSPSDILKISKERGMKVISLTDHDTLAGALELQRIGTDSRIKIISGVEIDTLDTEINYHILAYGADLYNERLNTFIKQVNEQLENVNLKLIKKMKCVKHLKM